MFRCLCALGALVSLVSAMAVNLMGCGDGNPFETARPFGLGQLAQETEAVEEPSSPNEWEDYEVKLEGPRPTDPKRGWLMVEDVVPGPEGYTLEALVRKVCDRTPPARRDPYESVRRPKPCSPYVIGDWIAATIACNGREGDWDRETSFAIWGSGKRYPVGYDSVRVVVCARRLAPGYPSRWIDPHMLR